MSSQRKPQGRPGPAAGGPPPERKAAGGPMLTPQVLMVVYFLLLVIGVAVYWNVVVKKSQDKIVVAEGRESQANTQRDTYKKKGEKLAVARKLNTSVRDKLRDVSYMFLTDQSSMIPFWEQTFFPVFDSSRLSPGPDFKIKLKPYTFHLNMAMDPFNTLPSRNFFDNNEKVFPIQYEPEQGGVPIDTPLDTRPADFLTPYTIQMEGVRGTYEGVKSFIENLQLKQDKTLMTVHCFKNEEDKNSGFYRTESDWKIIITVYFINPEATANGDAPPTPPGAESC